MKAIEKVLVIAGLNPPFRPDMRFEQRETVIYGKLTVNYYTRERDQVDIKDNTNDPPEWFYNTCSS